MEKIKVIWVDDESDEIIDNKLQIAGIDTAIFESAEEAIKEYRTHKGTYQAIIFDLQGKMEPRLNSARQ